MMWHRMLGTAARPSGSVMSITKLLVPSGTLLHENSGDRLPESAVERQNRALSWDFLL
jgi:hypothetical protein